MNATYSNNIVSANDHERVEALMRYDIFNSQKERAFDNIAKLAQTIFDVPVVHISFLDAESEFIKASVGLPDMGLVDRSESICTLAITDSDITVIENALLEARLIGHPAVYGDFGLRFYAGAPIITPDGFIIGTMCLVDYIPKKLTSHEIEILLNLANVVMEQVELRLSNSKNLKNYKDANKKLASGEKRLRSILHTMAEGVMIVDAEQKLEYANSMAERILGLSEKEIREHTFSKSKYQNLRMDGKPLPHNEHPMAVIMETGLPVYDQEVCIQPPGRERFYITINAAPIFDQKGNLTGGIATFTDVTHRHKLMKQKDEFISIASHELKTPLTSLKASLQLLNRMKSDLSSPKVPELISQANKSQEKLSKLVNALLNVARISQGQLQLHKTLFTVSEMISECCPDTRAAGNYQIQFKGDPKLQVYADIQQIDQVVVNLVNNAVKYAPNSMVIEVIAEKLDGIAKISVKDSGPGIPAEKIPHLFERYYRADYSGPQFSGLGLGLYICSDIIKKHGGEIGVDTNPGNGSTFWITLPLQVCS